MKKNIIMNSYYLPKPKTVIMYRQDNRTIVLEVYPFVRTPLAVSSAGFLHQRRPKSKQ